MRIFSYVLALVVGLACWALVLVFSGGVAPLGQVGQTEGLVFFTPIGLFALPLAVLAFVRGHALTSAWLFSLAPLLGFANFALSVSASVRSSRPGGAAVARPETFALLWCAMLAMVLVLLVVGRMLAPGAGGAPRR